MYEAGADDMASASTQGGDDFGDGDCDFKPVPGLERTGAHRQPRTTGWGRSLVAILKAPGQVCPEQLVRGVVR